MFDHGIEPMNTWHSDGFFDLLGSLPLLFELTLSDSE
jgi:hypothetical protein